MPAGSAAASKLHPPPKPPKKEKEPLPSPPNLNPNPSPAVPYRNSGPPPMPPPGEGCSSSSSFPEDAALAGSRVLSREEVIRRRVRRAKQLDRVYRDQYWALIEELRIKHRDYYWEYGKSPFEEEEEEAAAGGGGGEENGNGEVGPWPGAGEERKRCAFSGCKSKAMPLTRFCHQHIMADGKQTLYKPCEFVTKSAQSVHITCGKPVLRATVPSLCPLHVQKIHKNILQILKKAGHSSSNKPVPQFHDLVAEYVRQIHTRRRNASSASINSDKPSDSSLETIDWGQLDAIGEHGSHPAEKKQKRLQGTLQNNKVSQIMGSNMNKAQPACSMTSVE